MEESKASKKSANKNSMTSKLQPTESTEIPKSPLPSTARTDAAIRRTAKKPTISSMEMNDESNPYVCSKEMSEWNTVLEQTIATIAGGEENLATPTISSLSKEEEVSNLKGNTIPIGAEYEDELVPSDYDAYGGETLNF